jgi:hypothetical protein
LGSYPGEFAALVKATSTTSLKRQGLGGLVAFIGYLLSPLSWWNDLFVNVPLALAFAWLVSCIHRAAFAPSFVLGYWLTNVLGMVLLHRGTEAAMGTGVKGYNRRQILRDLLIALAYTALIVALVKLGILGPLPDYFSRKQ